MTQRVANLIRRHGGWLNSLMFLSSAVIWLEVSSNRNNILHAIGKLGLTANGYGTVNIVWLFVGLSWSIGGCFVAKMAYDLGLKAKPALLFFLGILILVVTSATTAVVFDFWFSISLMLGLAWEFLELAIASLVAWIVLFKPSHRDRLSDLVGSVLFGMLGLIACTCLALLAFPRISFRF